MTTRPPYEEHDALGPDERALAAQLSRIEAGGPSAALDARILAAARTAIGAAADTGRTGPGAPVPATGHATRPPSAAVPRRAARRWPTALGAAATLVIAVGLAWQLKPLIDMPPPLRRPLQSPAAAEAEVLAQAEAVSPAAAPAPPVEAAADAAAPPAATVPAPIARAPRQAPSDARAPAVAAPSVAAAPVARDARHEDYLDEAVGDPSDPRPAAVAAAAPQAPAPAAATRVAAAEASPGHAQAGPDTAAGAVAATAQRASPTLPPVSTDARLDAADWLERIRARRDAGQVADARASLRRFLRTHPRHRLPDDLRALLVAPR